MFILFCHSILYILLFLSFSSFLSVYFNGASQQQFTWYNQRELSSLPRCKEKNIQLHKLSK